ncbi:MAG: TldD/PmbA family protein [Sulfolobales archaeon]|nr:TldD/PmbA family protein [Sulfolobales archaeon]
MMSVDDVDYALKVLDEALSKGAIYVLVRLQEKIYESITADCGVLKNYGVNRISGLGLYVIADGGAGYVYTTSLSRDEVSKMVENAISIAKSSVISRRYNHGFVKPVRDSYTVNVKEDPQEVEPEDKVRVVLDVNRESIKRESIVSAVTRMAIERDKKFLLSSEGTEVKLDITCVGFAHTSVAKSGELVERVGDHKTFVGGYEFIRSNDWFEFADELNQLAVKASMAKTPSPGSYVAVVDNDVVGLLLHEALGHASEGDLVINGESVLSGKIGEKVASELVTIFDEGVIDGGYPVPYDDEGVPKRRTKIIDEGVLTGYLSNREVSADLNQDLTGNGRAQDVMHIPLVRQTNYYMKGGDWSVEELFDGISYGIYLKGVGSIGGEVRPSVGTYTFSIGPSYIIRNGDVAELVRGVSVSGMILETLKEVDAVAGDLKISTSVFGGCGKDMQSVRVGFGGPHLRVKKVVIGG